MMQLTFNNYSLTVNFIWLSFTCSQIFIYQMHIVYSYCIESLVTVCSASQTVESLLSRHSALTSVGFLCVDSQ